MRILMIEDDLGIAIPLRRSLERERYEVRISVEGNAGVDVARVWHPHMILLDVQLPDADGRDLARALRGFTSAPIIMLTGLGEVEDKVDGLDAGATDYMVKPFDTAELLARIRAHTRTVTAPAEPRKRDAPASFADLTIDLAARKVFRDGKDLGLSLKEFEIIRVLAAAAPAIVRRSELAHAIWGASPSELGNSIDVHMSWLRKKLGDDPKAPRYVETIRGRGFRLRGDLALGA